MLRKIHVIVLTGLVVLACLCVAGLRIQASRRVDRLLSERLVPLCWLGDNDPATNLILKKLEQGGITVFAGGSGIGFVMVPNNQFERAREILGTIPPSKGWGFSDQQNRNGP